MNYFKKLLQKAKAVVLADPLRTISLAVLSGWESARSADSSPKRLDRYANMVTRLLTAAGALLGALAGRVTGSTLQILFIVTMIWLMAYATLKALLYFLMTRS